MMQKNNTVNTRSETKKASGGKPVLKLGTNLKAGAYVGVVLSSGWGAEGQSQA